jgi:hypothetical protein
MAVRPETWACCRCDVRTPPTGMCSTGQGNPMCATSLPLAEAVPLPNEQGPKHSTRKYQSETWNNNSHTLPCKSFVPARMGCR